MSVAKRANCYQGFTLVELMLAMSFLAMLLLMISMLILQVAAIYNKGLTLKAVNETGQLISSELQRSIATAPDGTVSGDYITEGEGGRICVDGIVYAWNEPQKNTLNKYEGSDSSTQIRFIKFKGSKSDYCERGEGGSLPTGRIKKDEVTELINPEEQGLAIRKFAFSLISVDGIDGDRTQRLFKVAFTLGTNETDLIDAGGKCKPPSQDKQEFCAVNEFEFIVRTTSGVEA